MTTSHGNADQIVANAREAIRLCEAERRQLDKLEARMRKVLALFGADEAGRKAPAHRVAMAATYAAPARPGSRRDTIEQVLLTGPKVMTPQQIADALGINVKAVNSELWRMQAHGLTEWEGGGPGDDRRYRLTGHAKVLMGVTA